MSDYFIEPDKIIMSNSKEIKHALDNQGNFIYKAKNYYNWNNIRDIVRAGKGPEYFPVGSLLYDDLTSPTSLSELKTKVPLRVVQHYSSSDTDYNDPDIASELGHTWEQTPRMMLMEDELIYSVNNSNIMQFDAIEAFLYTTVEMQPGTYKFKIPNYDTAYGGNKTYYFTSTASVPIDSQIMLSWTYQQPPKTVTAYAGPNPQTKTTAITGFNALTLSEWIDGESPEAIDLGTIKLSNNDPDSTYGKLNHIHRARYGSNNYIQSGLRQALNANTAGNTYWQPQTIFDRPYGSRSQSGRLYQLNQDFVSVLATPEIKCITNNIFEYQSLDGTQFSLQTQYTIRDKVFLPTHTEINLSSNPNVGSVLSYWVGATNADRIKIRRSNGNAYYWWLRTPYPTYAGNFRSCNASGALGNYGAISSHGVAPAYIIQ